jgi:hypothetical protein
MPKHLIPLFGNHSIPALEVELKDGEIPAVGLNLSSGYFIFQCPDCDKHYHVSAHEISQSQATFCYNVECNEAPINFIGFSLCDLVPIETYLKVLLHRAEGDLKQAIENAIKVEGQSQVDAIAVAADLATEKGE